MPAPRLPSILTFHRRRGWRPLRQFCTRSSITRPTKSARRSLDKIPARLAGRRRRTLSHAERRVHVLQHVLLAGVHSLGALAHAVLAVHGEHETAVVGSFEMAAGGSAGLLVF